MRELDRSHLSQSKSRAWRASRRLKKRHLGRPCRFSHYELCRPSWLSSAENLKNALCSFVISWHSLQIPFGSDSLDVKTNSGSLFEVWTRSRLTVLLKITKILWTAYFEERCPITSDWFHFIFYQNLDVLHHIYFFKENFVKSVIFLESVLLSLSYF